MEDVQRPAADAHRAVALQQLAAVWMELEAAELQDGLGAGLSGCAHVLLTSWFKRIAPLLGLQAIWFEPR
ncbi:hypothetical protein ACFSHR_00655 [Azotobacter chroococcum]